MFTESQAIYLAMQERWLGLLFIFLLFVAGAFAQTAREPAAQKAIIQGMVSRSGTGEALSRARVTLRRAEPGTGQPGGGLVNAPGGPSVGISAQVVTDGSGRFVFGAVDPGTYRMVVELDGYLRQEYGQRSYTGRGALITVSPGQRVNDLNFQMVPASTITGRAFDETGQPMAGVTVQAQTYSYNAGRKELVTANQVQTNDLGEYRLYWMMPGEYYINATARQATMAIVGPDGRGGPGGGLPVSFGGDPGTESQGTYVPTYYPGTITPESAAPVALPPAAEIRGIDFILRPTITATLRGRVATSDSAAQAVLPSRGTAPVRASGPQIHLMLNRVGFSNAWNQRGLASQTILDGSGPFQIRGVVPGTYNLIAVAQQNAQSSYAARMQVVVGNTDIDNLNVVLRPGIDVPGRIQLNGTPSPQFQITQLRVQLDPTDDVLLGVDDAKVNDDRTFVLKDVPPLEYRVRVVGLPPGAYIQAGLIESTDAVRAPFVIAGNPQATLQLQLGFDAGRIAGVVNDAKANPFPGGVAALIPEESDRLREDLYFWSSTDQNGRFTFNNVPPGLYKLFAWEEMPPGALQNPDFIRKFEDRGKPIKVLPNGNITADITLIPVN